MSYKSPGALEFSWGNSSYQLDPVVDSGKLWILLKDSTSTKETYAMRYKKGRERENNVGTN